MKGFMYMSFCARPLPPIFSFLSSQSVIQQLKEEGGVRTPTSEQAKSLLSLPLKCNQCGYLPINIPDLKRHLKEHLEKK